MGVIGCRARAEPDGTCAETRFSLSPKRMSPFKSAGESVQSTAGSRVARISVSNAGYTMLRGRVRVLATHSIRQFPLHFPSHASLCAITFRTRYTKMTVRNYHYSCNNPGERSSHLIHNGSLKSRTHIITVHKNKPVLSKAYLLHRSKRILKCTSPLIWASSQC